nr:gas vesicle protein GvpJ [Streptomyces sp. TS71-3]
MGVPYGTGQGTSANLADILERVLDRGIVIAGDIQINLLDIELLTIKLRLLVASVDKAREMGIDWWEHDPSLSSRARDDAPGRQMAAGPSGAGSGPPVEKGAQDAEVARLRAEVAELRAAAGLPEGASTRSARRPPESRPSGTRPRKPRPVSKDASGASEPSRPARRHRGDDRDNEDEG